MNTRWCSGGWRAWKPKCAARTFICRRVHWNPRPEWTQTRGHALRTAISSPFPSRVCVRVCVCLCVRVRVRVRVRVHVPVRVRVRVHVRVCVHVRVHVRMRLHVRVRVRVRVRVPVRVRLRVHVRVRVCVRVRVRVHVRVRGRVCVCMCMCVCVCVCECEFDERGAGGRYVPRGGGRGAAAQKDCSACHRARRCAAHAHAAPVSLSAARTPPRPSATRAP